MHIAMKRGLRKAMKKNPLGRAKEKLELAKASVRAKVEHPFHVLKNLFKHRKARYRGLAKNTEQLHSLFAFANLVLAGRTFEVPAPELRPEPENAYCGRPKPVCWLSTRVKNS